MRKLGHELQTKVLDGDDRTHLVLLALVLVGVSVHTDGLDVIVLDQLEAT